MNKITIIGGCGYLGKSVVEQAALNKNNRIQVIDLKITNQIKSKNIKYIKEDIKNFSDINKLIKSQDFVIHLAGIADLDEAKNQPKRTFEENIMGTINVLESCVKNKIKKFTFSSSLYVNGDHGGFYTCSKKACENYIEEYGRKFNLNFLILRFGSLYGSGSDITNGLHKIIYNSLKQKRVSYYGNPEASREYIHVEDAGKATIDLTLQKKFVNQKVNISGHNTIKITELLEMVKEITNIKRKIMFAKKKHIGHYIRVPYSSEKIPKKYTINPSIDFPEGLNHLINQIKKEI